MCIIEARFKHVIQGRRNGLSPGQFENRGEPYGLPWSGVHVFICVDQDKYGSGRIFFQLQKESIFQRLKKILLKISLYKKTKKWTKIQDSVQILFQLQK